MNNARSVHLPLAFALMCTSATGYAQQLAHDYLQHGLRLADAYNWVNAGKDFVKAERLFTAAGDRKDAYYARLGKMRSTIDHGALPEVIVQLADDLNSVPFLRTDRRLRMFCLTVKGDFDSESDHAAMARDWDEVRSIASELGDKKWEYRATAQLGIAAYYNADLEGARQRVGRALLGAHNIGDKPGEMLDLAILAMGLTYAKLYDQALPYAEQSIKVSKTDPDMGYPTVAAQAKLDALIGTGKLAPAQSLADEVLAFARTERGGALEAVILTQLARLARLRNDDARAITLLDDAIQIATKGGYLNALGAAQSMLAEIYVDRKDLQHAEMFADRAANAAQARGDFIALPERLNTLARVQVAEGKYTEADRVYTRADAFVDSLVGRTESPLDKVSLIAASSDLYRRHFALIADHFHDARRAYDIVEQVRGRVMADLLAAGSFTAPASSQIEMRAARMRLKLMAARSDVDVRRISDQLFILEQARWVTPDVSILKTKARTRIDIAAVQRDLPPSTAILEYVTGMPLSYCLVITRADARIVPLVAGSTIERDIAEYLELIKAKRPADQEARALFITLLQPIREATENEKLVVIRDGQLHLLPFDALIDLAGRYVAETKTVSYAESASTFDLLRHQPRSKSGGALLGVGAVPYDENDLHRAAVTRGYDVKGLANLPASKDELIAAAAAVSNLGNQLLLGSGATESAFKREPLARFRVLHLAVHGLSNTEQPDRAALVMLSDPAAGEDGFLQASEIVHLRLNADLVVLSACDTAIGPIGGEEGIDTLSRAFLLAGSRTVVSTLWSIEDFSSLVLMRQFYGHLAAHISADQALTQAKRDVIRRFGRNASPYYWAAFTLEGAGDQTSL